MLQNSNKITTTTTTNNNNNYYPTDSEHVKSFFDRLSKPKHVAEPNHKRQSSKKASEKRSKNLTRSNSTTTQESDRAQSVFERLAKPKHVVVPVNRKASLLNMDPRNGVTNGLRSQVVRSLTTNGCHKNL